MILHSYRYPREETRAPGSVASTRFIFLHGTGGNGSLWRPIAAGLEDHADILCPDQRGHGESILPGSVQAYGPLDYAGDIVETVAALGFSSAASPAWVVGHSMGVRTACGYAKLDPQAVAGLVLVDLGLSGPAGGGVGDALSSFLRDLPPKFPDRASARAFLAERCPDPSIAQYLLAVSRPASGGGIYFPFDQEALVLTFQALGKSETAPWMEAFARDTGRPVHILRGAESGVYRKETFEARRVRFASLPNVQLRELPGAGHGLPFEKRPEFVAMLREWSGLPPSA